MADLEDGGFSYQPHTSQGECRRLRLTAFRAKCGAGDAQRADRDWNRGQMAAAKTTEEITERAGHVWPRFQTVLGIIRGAADATYCFGARAHVAASGRPVVVVLSSPGGSSRDKIVKPNRSFTQAELDATADSEPAIIGLDARSDSGRLVA